MVGPHGHSDDSQGRDHSCHINMGHLEGPWDTHPRESTHADMASLLDDQDTHD